MAMKKFRKDVGGETWAQFHKHARKYRVRFWKRSCPWKCRPHLCVQAFLIMKKNKPLKDRLLLEQHYSYRYPEQKRWQ